MLVIMGRMTTGIKIVDRLHHLVRGAGDDSEAADIDAGRVMPTFPNACESEE